MSAGQPLKGLVAQGVDGRRKVFQPYTVSYPQGSFTWTCPLTGWYRFVNWGAGGGSGGIGASGAHTQTVVRMAKGQTVAVVVSAVGGANSSFIFPSGRVALATSGLVNTPGTASGGDINLNGSPAGFNGLGDSGGTGTANGGGAPGNGGYRGGNGETGGVGAGNGTAVGFAIITRQPSSIV
jgi:hypothetical protein